MSFCKQRSGWAEKKTLLIKQNACNMSIKVMDKNVQTLYGEELSKMSKMMKGCIETRTCVIHVIKELGGRGSSKAFQNASTFLYRLALLDPGSSPWKRILWIFSDFLDNGKLVGNHYEIYIGNSLKHQRKSRQNKKSLFSSSKISFK